MAAADKLLSAMQLNPRDWRIEDVISVCRANGIDCTQPRNGAHYKVKHARMAEILTVPAARPSKPVYIRDLVRFVDAVGKTLP